MAKYRIMFSKTGAAKYVAHLDLNRIFERSCRRAELPLAFSQGFNPHPKISFAVPLAVGVSGEKEFMDIELTEDLKTEDILNRLNDSLPSGIKVLDVRRVDESIKEKPLMARVNSADYRIECEVEAAIDQQQVDKAVTALLSSESLPIERVTKGKTKVVDIRPGVLNLKGQVTDNIIVIETELRTGSNGNVKPEELLKQLQMVGLPIDDCYCNITRIGVYSEGEANKELW
ncbi:TIGR03936 family radical SAM-associated protein [Peptococcaceae bacterium 1198_IL3148]